MGRLASPTPTPHPFPLRAKYTAPELVTDGAYCAKNPSLGSRVVVPAAMSYRKTSQLCRPVRVHTAYRPFTCPGYRAPNRSDRVASLRSSGVSVLKSRMLYPYPWLTALRPNRIQLPDTVGEVPGPRVHRGREPVTDTG